MITEFPNFTKVLFVSEEEIIETFNLIIDPKTFNTPINYKFGEIYLIENVNGKEVHIAVGENYSISHENYRKLGGNLSKFLQSHKIVSCKIEANFINQLSKNEFLCFLEGFLLGNFKLDGYSKELAYQIIDIYIQTIDSDLKMQILSLHEVCCIINFCRKLGQLPGNLINPPSLAHICEEIAQKYSIRTKVLDELDLENLGANAILAVGNGSASKPRLIVLEYNPEQSSQSKPIILVGKAITFDTGGYSIKTVDRIKNMKFDKMGGITVLGTLLAASSLKLKTKIVGIICAAENMISHDAYRPDDIIQTLSGKTVEILSTDNEGRLVLADGITYAQQFFDPKYIIDFATLTSDIVTALGKIRAGLFSNNKSLSNDLFESGEYTNERLWPMPLDDEYFELIKGDDADLKNAGGKEGHLLMGAIFLEQFIENDIPWAHIDIAGVAISLKAENYFPKGANGFGIRLMIDFLNKICNTK